MLPGYVQLQMTSYRGMGLYKFFHRLAENILIGLALAVSTFGNQQIEILQMRPGISARTSVTVAASMTVVASIIGSSSMKVPGAGSVAESESDSMARGAEAEGQTWPH
jgi:hypothetical protein